MSLAFPYGFAVGVWLTVAVLWAPMLASDRVRSLFVGWPTDHTAVNYLASLATVTFVHVALFIAGGLPLPSGSPLLVGWALASNVIVPTLAWLAVVVVVPRTERGPSPTGGVAWPLALGAGWYAVVTTVGAGILALLLLFANLPT